MARIEGRGRGYEDMILLNASGRVAESTGACILMVRDGELATTPTWEGAMESITVDVLNKLAASSGIDLVHRPIERSELHVADELGLTGTLTEITLVRTVDEYPLPEEQPILSGLAPLPRRGDWSEPASGSRAHDGAAGRLNDPENRRPQP